MNVLFVCGRARRRSATAERLFADAPGWAVACAGISKDADEPLTGELVEWADAIVVMESAHRRKLQRDFGRFLSDKKVVCLDIADEYEFMQAELVELLRERVRDRMSRAGD